MWESLAGAAAALVAVPAALAVPIADTPVCCPYEDGCRFGCTTSYSLMPVGQAVFPVPTTTTTSSVYRYCFTYTEDITVTVTQPGDGSNTQATLTVTGPPVVGATSTSTISASPVTVTDFAGGGGNGVVFTTSTFTNTITQFASTVTVSDPRSTATQLITVKSPDLYRPIVDTLDQVPQAMADLATDGANTTNAWEQAAEEDIDPLDKALFAIDDLASRLVYKRGLDEDRCSRCGTCPCSCPPCTVCGEKECKCGGAVNLAARQGSGYENVPVDVHCIDYRYADDAPFVVVTRTITATAVGSSPATTTGTVTVTVPGPGGDFTTTVVTGEQQTVTTTVTLPSATTTQTIQQVIITSTVTTVPVTVTVAGFTTTTHYFPACATIDNQIAVLSGGRAINGFQESGIPDLQTVDLSFTSASESPYECCASCWRDDGTDYDGVGPDKTCWGSLWREGTCMVLRGPGLCLQPRHGAYFVSGLHNVLSMVASNGKCGYLYDDAFLTITPELVGDTAAGSIGDAEDA